MSCNFFAHLSGCLIAPFSVAAIFSSSWKSTYNTCFEFKRFMKLLKHIQLLCSMLMVYQLYQLYIEARFQVSYLLNILIIFFIMQQLKDHATTKRPSVL